MDLLSSSPVKIWLWDKVAYYTLPPELYHIKWMTILDGQIAKLDRRIRELPKHSVERRYWMQEWEKAVAMSMEFYWDLRLYEAQK